MDILRAAFDATVKDAAFLAEARKAGVSISPASGAVVQALVEKAYATPESLVKRSEAIRASGAKKK